MAKKAFSFRGLRPLALHQGLCPWTSLGAPPPDPRYRLALRALAMVRPPFANPGSAPASQICEIARNSEKIRTYSSSTSSKVINLGANRKRMCNFLLVINSNLGRISYRFRDIDA